MYLNHSGSTLSTENAQLDGRNHSLECIKIIKSVGMGHNPNSQAIEGVDNEAVEGSSVILFLSLALRGDETTDTLNAAST